MIARALGLALLLVCLAACPARTRRVGAVVSAPPEPPSLTVGPLQAADLARNPTRGLVLGAGGPGRARPVRLLGRAHWLQLAAPVPEKQTGWATFWLVARPTAPVPDPGMIPNSTSILPPVTTPSPSATPSPEPSPNLNPSPDVIASQIPQPPTGPPLSGPAWTRALWLARRAATAAVGKSPIDFELTAISRGNDVEPPTEATLAVAAIAALTGARIAHSAAVVAGLEPDGSLAPLDDPVGEMQRALSRGARRLVLPLGGGLAAPAAGGQAIDLVSLSSRAGATAVLAPDLVGAYRSLTSSPLPEPRPVSAGDLALAGDESAALENAYRRALQRIAVTWPRMVEQQNRARLPPQLAALVSGAERGARRAEKWRAAGDLLAGYVRLSEATALADAALRLDRILRLVSEGDFKGVRAEIDSALAAPDAARLEPPGGSSPVTIGEHLRATGLFSLAAACWAWSEEAGAHAKAARTEIDSLARIDRAHLASPVTARKVADALAPLLIASSLARLHAALLEDRAALESGGGPGFATDPDALRAVAAADASTAAGVLADLVRASEWQDPAPAMASSGSGSSSSSGSDQEPGWGAPMESVVAGRMLSLVDAEGELVAGPGRARVPTERSPLLALAVARNASDLLGDALARMRRLRPRFDPWTGQVTSVGLPARLGLALELAERAALKQAAAARVAVGSIPLGARLAYRAAAALARGDRLDRMKALELYQVASAECRMAVLLGLSEAVGLSEAAAPTTGAGFAVARAGCLPSPSARRACR